MAGVIEQVNVKPQTKGEHGLRTLKSPRASTPSLYISITTSSVTPAEADRVEKFLADFLPKVRQLPGVVAAYHYDSPEKGEDTTIIIWKDKEALAAYRQGSLVRTAIDFETKNGLKSTRNSYPLTISL